MIIIKNLKNLRSLCTIKVITPFLKGSTNHLSHCVSPKYILPYFYISVNLYAVKIVFLSKFASAFE